MLIKRWIYFFDVIRKMLIYKRKESKRKKKEKKIKKVSGTDDVVTDII